MAPRTQPLPSKQSGLWAQLHCHYLGDLGLLPSPSENQFPYLPRDRVSIKPHSPQPFSQGSPESSCCSAHTADFLKFQVLLPGYRLPGSKRSEIRILCQGFSQDQRRGSFRTCDTVGVPGHLLAWNPLLRPALSWNPRRRTVRITLVGNGSPERGSHHACVRQQEKSGRQGRVVPLGHIPQE